MELTYEDDVSYWKLPIGMSYSAKQRLIRIHSVQDKDLLEKSYNILIEKMDLSLDFMKGGPLEQLMNETQSITILDSVIPCMATVTDATTDEVDVIDVTTNATSNATSDAITDATTDETIDETTDVTTDETTDETTDATTDETTDETIDATTDTPKKKLTDATKNLIKRINIPIRSPSVRIVVSNVTKKIDPLNTELSDELKNVMEQMLDTSERDTSERKTSERDTSERKTSERKTSEIDNSERKTSERKTSKRKISEKTLNDNDSDDSDVEDILI